MNYYFPKIEHIDEVLPIIKDKKEFIVADRNDYKIINYNVVLPDTFPNVKTSGGNERSCQLKSYQKAILRECRGLVFDSNGYILSRRFHKFFNVGEKEETLTNKIDITKSHLILEKLDGSMVTPLKIKGNIRWATKMGITDTAMNAETFLVEKGNYVKFVSNLMNNGYTPIFEWCSRQNRIVIDYPYDRLVLLAVRHTINGNYIPYDVMIEQAKEFGIDYVKSFPVDFQSMQDILDHTKDLENTEGYVIRFDDGHMLKIKGDWYLRIHKTKDNLNFEKNIVDLIVNSKIDDAKSYMLESDKKRVEDFEYAFWYNFNLNSSKIEEILKACQKEFKGDKRQFAINKANQLDNITRRILFSCFDNSKSVRNELLKIIQQNTSTQSQIDSIRHLWGNIKW